MIKIIGSHILKAAILIFIVNYLVQAAPAFFIHDSNGKLARVDVASGVVEVIGVMQWLDP